MGINIKCGETSGSVTYYTLDDLLSAPLAEYTCTSIIVPVPDKAARMDRER